MRSKNALIGAACGLALGAGVIAAVEAGTETAGAQSGFKVTPAQLQINQKISQAAVRRSNQSLNYLAPIRTSQSDGADDGRKGVTPLAQVPGSGQGWTSSQIGDAAVTRAKVANEAIDSEKIAPGGVTSGDLADNAVTSGKIDAGAVIGPKIAGGAVGTGKLDTDANSGLAYWASVDNTVVAPNFAEFFATRGGTSVVRENTGVYRVTFQRQMTQGQCAAVGTTESFTDNLGYYAKATFDGGDVVVRLFDENGNADNRDFGMAVFCL